jgi:hypothetical protein
MENWVRNPILISFNYVLEGSSSNNLTKVIMEALTIGEGMPRDQVASNLMNFGTNDFNMFQGTSVRHLEQITLSIIPLVKCIESLLQTLHAYFAHSPRQHLEFTKLAKIMETKGNKIVCNMKT